MPPKHGLQQPSTSDDDTLANFTKKDDDRRPIAGNNNVDFEGKDGEQQGIDTTKCNDGTTIDVDVNIFSKKKVPTVK